VKAELAAAKKEGGPAASGATFGGRGGTTGRSFTSKLEILDRFGIA